MTFSTSCTSTHFARVNEEIVKEPMSANDELEKQKRFIEAGLEGVERPVREAVEEVIRELSTHQVERKALDEQLRANQRDLELFNARYDRLFNSAPVGIVGSDRDGVITEANGTACAMLGTAQQSIVGTNLRDWIADDFQGQIDLHLRLVAKLGERKECQLCLGDEKNTWVYLQSIASKTSTGLDVINTFVDISGQKEAEELLVRTQRLRATGELCAGMSHNLNNILACITGPAFLLGTKISDSSQMQDVEEIVKAAMRARDLIRDMNSLYKRESHDRYSAVSLNDVIDQAISHTRYLWHDQARARNCTIGVHRELAPGVCVRAVEGKLLDVFINLITNSIEAIEGREGDIRIVSRSANGWATIEYSDTGHGMDEETRLRIFEPFFSTKSTVGTGIGMTTVYNAIVGAGGDIEVESRVGEGARFTIALPVQNPAVEEEAPAERPAPDKLAASVAGPGRVLIVEDNKVFALTLSRLVGRNHEATVFYDGASALRALSDGQVDFDVAIIDLGLPDMSGDLVAVEVKRSISSVATILLTGWYLDQGDPRCEPFDFVRQKPFESNAVLDELLAQAMQLKAQRAKEQDSAQ